MPPLSRTPSLLPADTDSWAATTAALNLHGNAVLPHLLNARECKTTAGLYADARHFRSRVVM